MIRRSQLRTLREAAGLSQEGLAALSGVRASTISRIERGRIVRPNPRTLAALEAALTAHKSEGAAP